MVVNLYNSLFRLLANDSIVLNYLGIGESATTVEKALHIQKRVRPQNIVNYVPLIAFYALPGQREVRNDKVYNVEFTFDIYTKDDVELAQNIGQRIIDLLDGTIPPLSGVENFECYWENAHESLADLPNTYCFTVVIRFSLSLG